MILKYLKGTPNYGIWYDRSNGFTLCTYIDIKWARDMDDRKSTSGGAFFLGERLVSWLSKKQDCTLQRTVEAEYFVATNNCNQVIWMK